MAGDFSNFSYTKLIVWQKAMQWVRLVYQISRAFPAKERYALTDQLRRAAVSVPSNIAEGNGRAGDKEYAHFLSIARGSLFESITQIQIAQDLGYVSNDNDILPSVESLAIEIGNMLTSMLKKYGTIHC